MEDYDNFKQKVQEFSEKFKSSEGSIRIICRNNVDAICACAIFVKVLTRMKKQFNVQIVSIIDQRVIKQFTKYPDEIFFFIDIGSRSIKEIQLVLKSKPIFIISRAETYFPEEIAVLNPFLIFNKILDPLGEISISGMSYLFAKSLDTNNKNLAYLGLIGVMSDNIRRREFPKLCKEIVDDAVFSKIVEIKRGLNLPYAHTCPVYKAIANSLNPFIPGVTGSEKKSAQFIRDIGLNLDSKKKLIDLSEEDSKKLLTEILLKRLGSEESHKNIIDDIYLVNLDGYVDELSDVFEVIRLLEACISLHQPSLALAFCINSGKNYKKSLTLLKQYRKVMVEALNWFHSSRKTEKVVVKENFVFIRSKEDIHPDIVVPFVNNLSDTFVFREDVLIILHNYRKDGDIDIVLRVVGDDLGTKLDLNNLIDPTSKFFIKDQQIVRQNALIRVGIEHEEEFVNMLLSRLNSMELVEDVE